MARAQTHVVVLAAGNGRRLGRLGEATPKWLLDVAGRTIADRHLEAIAGGAGLRAVHVVTGHAAEAIDAYLAANGSTAVQPIFNSNYARLNNWYSLLLALRSIDGEDARVVVVNADLCAHPEWIRSFVDAGATTDAEALIAIDLQRTLTDESMKVAAGPGGELERIGKVGIDEPVGEYVGMLMATGAALRALRETLEAFVGDPAAVDEWYEGAVGRTARAGTRWSIWPTPDSRWVEIDDHDDFAAAAELLA